MPITAPTYLQPLNVPPNFVSFGKAILVYVHGRTLAVRRTAGTQPTETPCTRLCWRAWERPWLNAHLVRRLEELAHELVMCEDTRFTKPPPLGWDQHSICPIIGLPVRIHNPACDECRGRLEIFAKLTVTLPPTNGQPKASADNDSDWEIFAPQQSDEEETGSIGQAREGAEEETNADAGASAVAGAEADEKAGASAEAGAEADEKAGASAEAGAAADEKAGKEAAKAVVPRFKIRVGGTYHLEDEPRFPRQPPPSPVMRPN
ncbi:hypothetical protein Q8F55_001686 [Vanrija albida]|uniref:Uncharacterized protein n=1 Tax=Vanrija albida TaxID=181172 RepID=A0ABR3Q7N5_9TREE